MTDSTKRILFIDDAESSRTTVKMALPRKGYKVDVLSYLDEVEGAAAEGKLSEYDAVITDLDLGTGADGLEVLNLVRSIPSDMPVLLWSGTAHELSEAQRGLFTKVLVKKGASGAIEEMDEELRAAFARAEAPQAQHPIARPAAAKARPHKL